jgi:hypothetical protein
LIAKITLIYNAVLLFLEFICLVTEGWAIGDSGAFDDKLTCNLQKCFGKDGVPDFEWKNVNDDCKSVTEGAAAAFALVFICYIVCLVISILFVAGDMCEAAKKHLDTPRAEKIMCFTCMALCGLGSFMALCGWATWAHNVTHGTGDGTCNAGDNVTDGASYGFYVLFWLFRLPMPVMFYFGSDVFNPNTHDPVPEGTGAGPEIEGKDLESGSPANPYSTDPAITASVEKDAEDAKKKAAEDAKKAEDDKAAEDAKKKAEDDKAAAAEKAAAEKAAVSQDDVTLKEKDSIPAGTDLPKGDFLKSANGKYKFVFQEDGNAVVYSGEDPLWASDTMGKDGERFVCQKDGNMVIYKGEDVVWSSDTSGNGSPDKLIMQDDGNLCANEGDIAKWCTRTDGGKKSENNKGEKC